METEQTYSIACPMYSLSLYGAQLCGIDCTSPVCSSEPVVRYCRYIRIIIQRDLKLEELGIPEENRDQLGLELQL